MAVRAGRGKAAPSPWPARRAAAEILHGPSGTPDGTMNLVGGPRCAMATTGYPDLKEFQRVEIVVEPTR